MKLPLLTLILLLWCYPTYAAWQVRLKDLPESLRQPLVEHFPQIEKGKMNKPQLDEVIIWLHEHLEADLVSFSEESPGLVDIQVRKIQRIGEIEFFGLSALGEAEARSYISFNRNDVYSEPLLIESGERLRQAYKELGYLNAEIDVEMPTNEKGQLIINIKVRENKRTEISKVVIESPQTELKTLLQRTTQSYKGKAFTDLTLNDLAQSLREALNSDGRYLTEIIGPEARFSADDTSAELIYRFEKIEKYGFDFKGQYVMTKKALENILDLEHYSSTNPNLVNELTQKLKNYYLSEGYARAEVYAQEEEPSGSYNRRLVFSIDEGMRIKIERYVFSGKFSKETEYYSEIIRKNSSDIVKAGFYNKDDLDRGFANLVTHLRNQGHLLAKIVSTRTQYNRGKDKISIYVNIDEGPITSVEDIKFTGIQAFRNEKLLDVLDLEANAPLRLNQLEQAIQDLKTFYFENGYIEMLLLNEKSDLVSYSADNTRASLNFKIFEGPRVTVNSIVIDGNYFTKDYVILNELDLTVGDTVTPSKIEESVTRLKRIGHFNDAEIRTLEEKTNVSQRTILVRVSERDPGIFTMGFGATNEREITLRGYTGIAYRNLFGTGRGVSLRLEGNYNVTDIKYLENKVTLGYLEPYLFNTRVRGRLNISRSKLVTDYDLRQLTEVNQTTWTIEKDFTSHVLGIWDLLSVATVKDSSLDSNDNIDDTLFVIASTGPTVDIDFRDNLFNPSRGTFTRFSAEYAAPELGSTETIRYWRSTAMFNHYLYMAPGPWVWANSWRVGFIENTNALSNGGIPYDKKGFVLGGRSTIRGYEAGTTEVFPNRRDLGSDKFILQTRAKMGLFKSEVRFPIYGSFSGALFYDGGYVEIEGLHFNDYYRDSVGIGFRYNTPVGPINLEYGWKLDRRDTEETGRFHFSIGTF